MIASEFRTDCAQARLAHDYAPAAMGLLVKSIGDDKTKILFHMTIMAMQNFGFFVMYFIIWGFIPAAATCDNTRFQVGWFAMVCFGETFGVVYMAFGGYIDDTATFLLGVLIHHGIAAMYCICTATIANAIWSDEGKACAAINPVNGERLKAVWIVHASIFLFYVWGMLNIKYYSIIKNRKGDSTAP